MRKQLKTTSSILLIGAFVFTILIVPVVQADKYDEQIKAISQDNNQKKESKGVLGVEAASLNDAIQQLQAQIDATQTRINTLNNEINDLQEQIKVAEAELTKQRAILGGIIKSMYIDGDVTTLEMLASSKDLSDFFDKQQYKESVQSKVKVTLDRVQQLKLDLNSKKLIVEKSLSEQQKLRNDLASQRGEKDRVLSLNQAEQDKLNNDIKANSSKISELRRQQAIENSRHGSGVVSGDSSMGGYPAKWANAPKDSMLDNWGMYNRECVSYAAWKVYESGRFMPYWGGRGNANEWPSNTGNKSKTPQVGTVAIAYWGYYGHAMYVEAISGNKVYVSQFNYAVRGEYSEMWINTSEIDWFLSF
ncbi:MAG: CHAP domain-containing protein [Patescibacteria group bacterium]